MYGERMTVYLGVIIHPYSNPTLEIISEEDNMWIIFQFMAHVSFVEIKLWYRNIKVSATATSFHVLTYSSFIIILSFSATEQAQWRKQK